MRLLLIEDDEVLVKALLEVLTHQRYVVDMAADGQMGWEYAQSANYDLILMDVGLPKLDGITLCQRLRSQRCGTPILLMTAKDATTDRIRGLDAGADDYLIKPLNLGELQARVRALLRRGEVAHTTLLQVGELRLDSGSCRVAYGEKLLELTPKEYSLLELFLRNPSRVFSRGQIVEHLWSFDDPPLEESVKAHIKGLRQRLKAAGAVDWIENVYGLGYRLSPKVGSSAPQSQPVGSEVAVPTVADAIPKSGSVEQEFHQALGDLWQHYQGLMMRRLEVLQKAVIAVQTGTLSEELRQSAGREAHKLAGVLGMFEREDGTPLAREIEQILLGDQALLSAQEGKLASLVQALSNLLDLAVSQSSAPTETSRLLLIDPDLELGLALQQLAQSVGMSWEQRGTLDAAKTWLQTHSPDLVVLGMMAADQWEASLALLAELAARTPPVPVLVITAADGLVDRVIVARAGAGGVLVKPVTATQVWDVVTQLLQRSRSQTVKLLVVDDDPLFLAALRPMLEPWGIGMTGLNDPLRFWEVLQAAAPDLLILDVEMPQLSGIELCRAVRTDPHWQELPILFLTAHRDRETTEQVFAAGADDYVTKPIVGPELLTRITNRLERTRLLQTLSTKDPLTGLANQPHSSRDLEHLLQMAERHCQSFCLGVLAVVELRQINTQYGHVVGNQVLQQWGQLFQAAFRGSEVLGYWGNGEFVVGMPGLSKAEAGDRLAEILTTLRQQIFTAMDGSRFQVTCHWAIAAHPTDGRTLRSLYQVATVPLES